MQVLLHRTIVGFLVCHIDNGSDTLHRPSHRRTGGETWTESERKRSSLALVRVSCCAQVHARLSIVHDHEMTLFSIRIPCSEFQFELYGDRSAILRLGSTDEARSGSRYRTRYSRTATGRTFLPYRTLQTGATARTEVQVHDNMTQVRLKMCDPYSSHTCTARFSTRVTGGRIKYSKPQRAAPTQTGTVSSPFPIVPQSRRNKPFN
jgi:hypothetical protein